jgi:micrococcal nuclease
MLAGELLKQQSLVTSGSPAPTPEVPFPDGGSYPFIRVVDGDTITVGWEGDIEYVRLIGIDAPEPNDQGSPECYATESTLHLQELLQTGVVTLRFDPSQGLRDKYNRLLAYVELPDGTDVSQVMLENGYAREYTYDRPYARTEAYKKAEADAAKTLRGLWGTAGC